MGLGETVHAAEEELPAWGTPLMSLTVLLTLLHGLLLPPPARAVHPPCVLRSCLYTPGDLALLQAVTPRTAASWRAPPPGRCGSHFNSHPVLGNLPPPATVPPLWGSLCWKATRLLPSPTPAYIPSTGQSCNLAPSGRLRPITPLHPCPRLGLRGLSLNWHSYHLLLPQHHLLG